MKLLILLLFPLFSFAQQTKCTNRLPLGVGLTGGYSSLHSAVGEMYFAIKASEHVIIYPMSVKVHTQMDNPAIPIIFEPRIAYKLHNAELYVGYGFHAAGQDGKAEYRKYTGMKPGAGIIYHLTKNIIVTTAISGRVATIQLGLFTTK